MKKYILCLLVLTSYNLSFAQNFPETMLILSKDKTSVVYVGPISEDPEFLEVFKAMPPTVKFIHLESSGGRLDIALEMATEISKRGMTTFTKNTCISACTFLFMAGEERWLEERAYVIFHQIRYYDLSLSETEVAVLKAYWQGRATQFYLSHGLNTKLTYEIEANKEIVKFGKDLKDSGYATSIGNYSLENFPSQFEVSDGKVLFPVDYVDPAQD